MLTRKYGYTDIQHRSPILVMLSSDRLPGNVMAELVYMPQAHHQRALRRIRRHCSILPSQRSIPVPVGPGSVTQGFMNKLGSDW